MAYAEIGPGRETVQNATLPTSRVSKMTRRNVMIKIEFEISGMPEILFPSILKLSIILEIASGLYLGALLHAHSSKVGSNCPSVP